MTLRNSMDSPSFGFPASWRCFFCQMCDIYPRVLFPSLTYARSWQIVEHRLLFSSALNFFFFLRFSPGASSTCFSYRSLFTLFLLSTDKSTLISNVLCYLHQRVREKRHFFGALCASFVSHTLTIFFFESAREVSGNVSPLIVTSPFLSRNTPNSVESSHGNRISFYWQWSRENHSWIQCWIGWKLYFFFTFCKLSINSYKFISSFIIPTSDEWHLSTLL